MRISVPRAAATALLTAALVVSGGTIAAKEAAAEPIGLAPSEVACGITTCTAYWSVARTREIHAEWKETLVGAGAVGVAGATVGAAAASGPAAPIVAGVGAAVAVRSLEFNHMINGAANDGRCLIYKFPKPAVTHGWFGSVHLRNEHCDSGPA
ncbi:hypothetical protein [Actinomycetospora sp. CA-084318]|uniref:hypothetical protein n=1 Tax=Actinomycetospora sp. CA-084318 TaxID=3239892 RepID=UPI003D95C7CC